MMIFRIFDPVVNGLILVILLTLMVFGVGYMGFRIGWINAIDYVESLNMDHIITEGE